MAQIRLKGHTDGVCCVTELRLLGHCIATGSEDSTIRLWRPSGVPISKPLKLTGDTVGAICNDVHNPDVLYAASANKISVVCVIGNNDSESRLNASVPAPSGAGTLSEAEPIAQLQLLRSYMFNGDDVSSLCLHPSSRVLASADDDGCVSLIDASKPKTGLRLLRVLRNGHKNICSGAAWGSGPTSMMPIVSGGLDCTLCVWSGSSGTQTLSAHAAGTLRLYSSLAAQGPGQGVAGYGRPPLEPPEPSPGSNGRGGKGGKGKSTSAPVPRLGFDPTSPGGGAMGSRQMCNPPFVHALCFSPCGQYLLMAHGDGVVAAWAWNGHPEEGAIGYLRPVWWSVAHASAATSLAFVPMGPQPGHGLDGSGTASSAAGDAPENGFTTPHCSHGYTLVSAGNDRVVCLWRWSDESDQSARAAGGSDDHSVAEDGEREGEESGSGARSEAPRAATGPGSASAGAADTSPRPRPAKPTVMRQIRARSAFPRPGTAMVAAAAGAEAAGGAAAAEPADDNGADTTSAAHPPSAPGPAPAPGVVTEESAFLPGFNLTTAPHARVKAKRGINAMMGLWAPQASEAPAAAGSSGKPRAADNASSSASPSAAQAGVPYLVLCDVGPDVGLFDVRKWLG